MVPDFKKLFEYNDWANNKLIVSLKEQNIIEETVLKLFSHIILSEQIWMLRLEGGDYSNKNFWKVLDLTECEKIMNENRKKYKSFLDNKDIPDTITYKNSKGIGYTNSIFDVFVHVSLHSAYHRGQIAKAVRRLHKEPVVTDYIAFIREK